MANLGCAHHSAKLHPEAVLDILENPDIGLKVFAARYGVSTVAVWKVRNGISWKHIKDEP